MQTPPPTQSTVPLTKRDTSKNKQLHVAIVGTGCTGLKIAHLLTQWQKNRPHDHHIKITLFEASARIGGFIQTTRTPGRLHIESAAQGVLSSRTIFIRTLEELGLCPRDVIAPPAQKEHKTRFVISPRGQLAPLTGPLSLLKWGVLTFLGLFRAFWEIFLSPQKQAVPNETLYHFFSRRFGKQVAENLIIPFATGIWGGGAERLLIRHTFPLLPDLERKHGGVIRGFLARKWAAFLEPKQGKLQGLKHAWPSGLISFPHGMQTLIETFEERLHEWAIQNPNCLDVRLSNPVHAVDRSADGLIRLNGADENFDAVFWTAAPWQTPELRWNDSGSAHAWSNWQHAPSHSLVVVNVSGPRDSFTRDGFGCLARRESSGLLGVLFVHSIYPQHVPEHSFSYRVLLGGDRCPEMVHWSDEQILSYTKQELDKLKLLDPTRTTAQTHIVRWKRAVGIADEKHDERQKALWQIQAHHPNLFFAGTYKKGVGVADALQSAQDCFEEWTTGQGPN